MRRIAPLFLASVLVAGVGCDTTLTFDWTDPCGGTCFSDEVCYDDITGAYCAPASDCGGFSTVCDYGTWAACVDLDNDPNNCGDCEAVCDGICSFGVCQAAGYTCADVGLSDCGTYCADLGTDSDCGACGNWCDVANGEFCAGGTCYGSGGTCEDYQLTTCPDGCVDLYTDPYNCGDCGIECVLGCDGAGNCM